MLPFWEGEQGNPSSLHSYARESRKAMEAARGKIAGILGAKPQEIFFTSGGSEGNNLLLRGSIEANGKKGRHVITSAVEHPSVLGTLQDLMQRGHIELTILPVDEHGQVSVSSLKEALRPDTVLVSIMTANNEVGTLEPIDEIGTICKENGSIFHSDGVQAAGHIPVDVKESKLGLLSLSAHKFHGPRGVGAVYIQSDTAVHPLITGGEQEHHLRAGTQNVPGIVGMAEALAEAMEEYSAVHARLQSFQSKLVQAVLSNVPNSRLTGHPTERLPGTVSFLFDGVSTDELLAMLDMNGIAASAGSACTAGSHQPSHVLSAMGLLNSVHKAPLRLSMSRYTTEDEVNKVIAILPDIVARLRG